MSNRFALFVLPRWREDGGEPIAHFQFRLPSLWLVLLAQGRSGPALDDAKPGSVPATTVVEAAAGPALQRLALLTEFIARHPLIDEQPSLLPVLHALHERLTCQVDRWGGPEKARFAVDFAWGAKLAVPDAASAADQAREACDGGWRSLRSAMGAGCHAEVDRLLGLDAPGLGGFVSGQAWAEAFGTESLLADGDVAVVDRASPHDETDAASVDPEDALSPSAVRIRTDQGWGIDWQADDGTRRRIVEPAFDAVSWGDGASLAWVCRDERLGLLRFGPSGGELLLAPETAGIDDATPFEDGFAIVVRNGRQGLLGDDGQWRIAPAFDELNLPSHGWIVFREGAFEGLADLTGCVRIAARFDAIGPCTGTGLMVAIEHGRAGLMQTDGQWRLAPDFDAIEEWPTGEGYRIRSGKRCGACDVQGVMRVAPVWDELEPIVPSRLYAGVRGGVLQLLDGNGQRCSPQPLTSARYRFAADADGDDAEGAPSTGAAAGTGRLDVFVTRGGRHGVLASDGSVRVPIEYAACRNLNDPVDDADPVFAVAQRGRDGSLRWGLYDADRAQLTLACDHDLLLRVPLTALQADTRYLVARRSRTQPVALSYGLRYADGSACCPTIYQGLMASDDDWMAPERQTELVARLATAWSAGESLEVIDATSGRPVWLASDGRALTHEAALVERAEAGDRQAALRLGLDLLDGNGVEADAARARLWLARAAGLALGAGDDRGNRLLAWLRARGEPPAPLGFPGPDTDSTGLPDAMAELAVVLINATGGPAQPVEGVAWLQRALEGTLSDRAYWLCYLGYLSAQGIGCTPDVERARRLYREAAELGNGAAWHNLGLIYQFGIGLESGPDFDQAWTCFQHSQVCGHGSCAFHFGDLRRQQALEECGPARSRRYREALYFLRSACRDAKAEHADEAAAAIAAILLDPDAETHDPAQAEALLQTFAALDGPCCTQLLDAQLALETQ